MHEYKEDYRNNKEKYKRNKDYEFRVKYPSKKALKKFKTQTSQLGGNENCQHQ